MLARMPPKKSSPRAAEEASLRRSSRSLEHGASAAGARHVRAGFAWTAEDDHAFALGYPYLTRLVEDHPDDNADDETLLTRVLSGTYSVDVPAKIALHRARTSFAVRTTPAGVLRDPLRALVARTDALGEEEARTSIAAAVADVNTPGDLVTRGLQALEAYVGPAVVADAVATALEALPAERLGDQSSTGMFARWLGFDLLRLPDVDARALRARMEALAAKVPEGFYRGSVRDGLDAALGKGATTTADALFPEGDPARVRAIVIAEGVTPTFAPDVRLVFLGGDELLDFYIQHAKRLNAYRLPRIIPELGALQSERAQRLLLLLAATSKAKKEALQQLVKNAARNRPFLEATAAGSGEEATWAAAVLAKLPKPRG
jgi:hypothetical protein